MAKVVDSSIDASGPVLTPPPTTGSPIVKCLGGAAGTAGQRHPERLNGGRREPAANLAGSAGDARTGVVCAASFSAAARRLGSRHADDGIADGERATPPFPGSEHAHRGGVRKPPNLHG
jgi:hypothetical protein